MLQRLVQQQIFKAHTPHTRSFSQPSLSVQNGFSSTHSLTASYRARQAFCRSVLDPHTSQQLEVLPVLRGPLTSGLFPHLEAQAAWAAATARVTSLDIAADMDSSAVLWPVVLSLLAGLSTSIGGLIAVTLSPDEGTLAFLLGTAIGVMATVSGVELWWHSAAQLHDLVGVTAAVLGGAALFAVLDPLLPKPPETEELLDAEQPEKDSTAEQRADDDSSSRQHVAQHTSAPGASPFSTQHGEHQQRAAHTTPSEHSGATSNSNSTSSRDAESLELQAVGQHTIAASQQQQQAAGQQLRPADKHINQLARGHDRVSSRQDTQKVVDQGRDRDGSYADAVMDIQPLLIEDKHSSDVSSGSSRQQSQPAAAADGSAAALPSAHQQKSLLRLSLLMGITMTLHNLPEGFAVAFSAFTDIAPIMVVAIGLHNIPEGLICAAPLYAATGSKWKAVGVATASGLSEPLGALLAVLVFKPFVKSLAALDYVLAATGGVMLAVCVLELWPEGRRCGRDGRLMAGIFLGVVVMGWTLYIGV